VRFSCKFWFSKGQWTHVFLSESSYALNKMISRFGYCRYPIVPRWKLIFESLLHHTSHCWRVGEIMARSHHSSHSVFTYIVTAAKTNQHRIPRTGVPNRGYSYPQGVRDWTSRGTKILGSQSSLYISYRAIYISKFFGGY